MSKTASIILSIVLSALIVGGGTYYLVSQASQNDKQELESQIEELLDEAEKISNENEEQPLIEEDADSEEQTSESDIYQEAKQYCDSRASSEETEVVNIVFVENSDGYFVECGIGAKNAEAVGGYASIGKKVSGEWEKLWEGNGIMEQSIVDDNNIPYAIHKGNTAPDEEF